MFSFHKPGRRGGGEGRREEEREKRGRINVNK